MTCGPKKDWKEYYQITKSRPPSPLLVEALKHVEKRGRVIDIGGGALKDTRYLLSLGFDVTVIDQEPMMAIEAEALQCDRLHAFVTSFERFDFPKNTYDIASAMYALPFSRSEIFSSVFDRIKASLVSGGIFCGQLFGDRDEWRADPTMTFHARKQAEDLLADMDVLAFDETEHDGKTATGIPKHWHVFNFIARRKHASDRGRRRS